MKKFFIAGMLLFLAFGMTVNVHASLIPATYDLISSLGNGSWIEILNGGHGGPGSTIIAIGPGWALTGTLSSVPVASTGLWQYQSAYQINLAIVAPGAWGEAVQISNVSGTNLSRRDNGKLEWHFTFTGYDNENSSIPIHFTAHFDSITPTPVSGITYFDFDPFLHGGSPLSQLTMQIVPIPAAAWLLGSGLIGLVVIRRRMKK